MGCLNAAVTQKPTGMTVNAMYARVTVTASIAQTCNVFLCSPLYAADGRLYAADAALRVIQTRDAFIGSPLYAADGRLYAADAALRVDK